MNKWIAITIVVFCVGIYFLIGWSSEDPHNEHFNFILPDSAVLEQYKEERSGFSDWTCRFRYKVADDKLLSNLIADINLVRTNKSLKTDSQNRPLSLFTSFADEIDWWPLREERTNFVESYFRTDREQTRYWSVWMDRERGILFVEKGNW